MPPPNEPPSASRFVNFPLNNSAKGSNFSCSPTPSIASDGTRLQKQPRLLRTPVYNLKVRIIRQNRKCLPTLKILGF